MKPSVALSTHRDAVRRIVEAHRARNPRVFGSAARGEDRDDSDLDLLIDAAPGMTLFDIGAIQVELNDLLGVRVDVRTPDDLPVKFRAVVVKEAVPV
jgi:predicted nucleotidyltransferase